MDENIDMCKSLIIWLQTFNGSNCNNLEELSDGVAVAHALSQIAPDFFNSSWLQKIKPAAANWRLKANNLKKILKGILDYYSDVLDEHIVHMEMPDVNLLVEGQNDQQWIILLQLILGCAVKCEQKEEYIKRIMTLEETVQHFVMNSIQELFAKSEASVSNDTIEEANEKLKKIAEELKISKKELELKCKELDSQISILQDDKSSLEMENERLKEKQHRNQSWDDDASNSNNKRLKELQTQLDKSGEEYYKMELQKDDMKIKCDNLEHELEQAKRKSENLNLILEENRQLKDELDVLKNNTHKMIKYEAAIEIYKSKLQELSELKNHIKIIEEKNASYVEQNIELETELRKVQLIKNQSDMYKSQVHELQIKIGEETKRADKAEFESKRAIEKNSVLCKERERLVQEKDTLKEMIEELKCSQVHEDIRNSPTNNSFQFQSFHNNLISNEFSIASDLVKSKSDSSDLEFVGLPIEIKDKIIRLQKENKMLKISVENMEDNQNLSSQLDFSKVRINELESEIRVINQRNLEIQAELSDFQENHEKTETCNDKDFLSLKTDLRNKEQKCERLQIELNNLLEKFRANEGRLENSCKEMDRLKDNFSKKESEMVEMENKYQMYLEKCRSYIAKLNNKAQNSNEIIMLKAQLAEKTKYIEHLENGNEKDRQVREFEEKAVSSAWFNLGFQLKREAIVGEQMANSNIGQSFLARQRLIHTRRSLQNINSNLQQNSR